MSLCIWTSLHLNLPEHKKEHLQKYRKLGWMILGLIAPEMVVWNAWEQRKRMKKLSKFMQNEGFMPVRSTLWKRICNGVAEVWQGVLTCLLLRLKDWPELSEPTPYRQYSDRIHPWTDIHSWFVVMGGMSFEDSAKEDMQFMPENRQRIHVTIEGFKRLLKMRKHLIPDISREYILDKSKSDRLAKLLTCWQAVYFCIQCVSRLSQRLSVTLLELNVFAHALCALALLAIWSDKPRDVCEPILIVGEEAMDICASLCLHVVANNRGAGYFVSTSMNDPGNAREVVRPTSYLVDSGFSGRQGGLVLKVLGAYWKPYGGELDIGGGIGASRIVTIDARDLRRLQRVSKFVQRETFGFHEPICLYPDVIPEARSCHSFARAGNWSSIIDRAILTTIKFVGGNLGALVAATDETNNSLAAELHNFAAESPHQYPRPTRPATDLETPRQFEFAWLTAGVTFAGTCYGGLHLVAWSTPFSSHAEALLWRAASVSIIAAGPFYAMVAIFSRRPKRTRKSFPGTSSALCSPSSNVRRCLRLIGKSIQILGVGIVFIILCFIIFCSLLWYLFCRVFIIVESFIMLAHISDQALQVPTWSAYVPHIV